MDALADLQNEKNKILSDISAAAIEGKADIVLSESGKLEKIEQLINRYRQITLELEGIKSNEFISSSFSKPINREISSKSGVGQMSNPSASREVGNKIRKEFVQKLEDKGIHLQLVKGKTVYLTSSGKRVGIAVATERQPHRWFLGLPVNGFDHAVLLCQHENGEVGEVFLQEKFFMEHGQDMSQSKGQLKFNIVQRNGGLLVQVPGTDGIRGTSSSSDLNFLI